MKEKGNILYSVYREADITFEGNIIRFDLENSFIAMQKANEIKKIVEYVFNVKGVSIEPVQGIQLYTPISNVKQQISRAVESKMLLKSTSTADSLQVKDYFALFAMHAILSEMQDPLSINDGTIASIAAKAYKIADSMILQSKESSDSNNNSENDIETSTE
jgi:hypothetical protein